MTSVVTLYSFSTALDQSLFPKPAHTCGELFVRQLNGDVGCIEYLNAKGFEVTRSIKSFGALNAYLDIESDKLYMFESALRLLGATAPAIAIAHSRNPFEAPIRTMIIQPE